MRRYGPAIVRTQLIYCLCFVILFSMIVFVIPDYVRALSCTKKTEATVLDVEENYLINRLVSYNYTLRLSDQSHSKIVYISNCKEYYPIGNTVTVEYRPDGFIYRIPNKLY